VVNRKSKKTGSSTMIAGIDGDGFEITMQEIPYSLFEVEFSHHAEKSGR